MAIVKILQYPDPRLRTKAEKVTDFKDPALQQMIDDMFDTHYAKKVTLDPNLLKEEKSIIEDLIAAAINDATDKIERNLRDKMGGLAGIKLPEGLGDLPK